MLHRAVLLLLFAVTGSPSGETSTVAPSAFTLPGKKGRETTVRRLGRIVGDDLVFDLRDGGRVALRLLSGRLVGDVVDPAGQIVTGHGTLELGRLRP